MGANIPTSPVSDPRRRVARRAVSAALVCGLTVTLGAGAMVATASSAAAWDQTVSPNSHWYDYYPSQDNSAGYVIKDFPFGDGSTALGAAGTSDTLPGALQWCIDAGINAPSTGTPQTPTPFPGDSVLEQRLGYIMATYGTEADRTNGPQMAAVSYIVHMNLEQYGSLPDDGRTNAITAGAPTSVIDQANAIWADAVAHAGNFVSNPVSNAYISASPLHNSGTLNGIGVTSDGAAFWPGIPFTVTATGSIGFDTNGDGKADTQTITGTTTAAAQSRGWVATGTGTGSGTLTVHYDMSGLYNYQITTEAAAGVQYTVTSPVASPASVADQAVTVATNHPFQPTVTTQVDNTIVDAGQAVPDNVTFGTTTGANAWFPGVTVKAEGTLYGPYDKPQTTQNSVPAGAPVAGHATVTVTAPGTVKAGADVIATGSGYYAWVWQFVKAHQARPDLFVGDFSDAFFTASETSTARASMDLSSDITTATEVGSEGMIPVDQLTIGRVHQDDQWLAPNGTPLAIPMIAEVSAPVAEHGAPITAVTQSIEFTATHYGTYTTGQDGVPAFKPVNNSGAYSVRLSVDTAKLTAEQKKWLDQNAQTATDGWWAPNEDFTIRMAPVVDTKVAEAQFDQANPNDPAKFPVIDNVTVSLKNPGDVWLTKDGKPVPVVVDNTFYGMFDYPENQRPLTAYDAKKAIGNDELTFTAPGTQATAGDISTTGVGYAWWASKVTENPQWNDAFQSDAWLKAETVTVRRAAPTVKTVAIAVADPKTSMTVEAIPVVGDTVLDTFTTTGTFPKGSNVIVDGYWAPEGTPFDAAHATHVWTSKPVPLVDGQTKYTTIDGFDTSSLKTAGTFGFVERVRDNAGNPVQVPAPAVTSPIPDGVLGESDETLHLIDVSTILGHEDTNKDGLMGDGDQFWDNIPITGLTATGATATLTSNVYRVDANNVTFGPWNPGHTSREVLSVSPDVCVDANKLVTLTVPAPATADGKFATERFTLQKGDLPENGALTMVETAVITRPGTDAAGNTVTLTRTIHGQCGAVTETGGPLFASHFQGGMTPPAKTGADPVMLLAGAAGVLLLLGASAGYVVTRRRRVTATK